MDQEYICSHELTYWYHGQSSSEGTHVSCQALEYELEADRIL